MMRDRSFRVFTAVYFIVGAAFLIGVSINFSSTICLLLLAMITLSYLSFVLFTFTRYQQIKKLASYLQSVYQGSSDMDIRDYCEGEVSLLKSDLYKITSTLRQQSELLQKDKVFLANSLSDISHQLKTPLTSMMVMNDLLDTDLPEAKRTAFIQQTRVQLERIEWLVSTLLKMSKIDANAVIFHLQNIALIDMLEKALDPFRIPMELKEQSCILTCDPSIMIMADRNWLVEAFSNIIKNCIEHTPAQGHLWITCEDTPLHVVLRIKDDGVGIDATDLPHIFERFYKGKNASNESAGIGLSLAKTICIHHNADLQVQSVINEGTAFVFRFFK